jgi:hypothetical protein
MNKKYKLVCKLEFGDIFVQLILWIILSLVTFGLAVPFFAYYFLMNLINKTEIHEVNEAA